MSAILVGFLIVGIPFLILVLLGKIWRADETEKDEEETRQQPRAGGRTSGLSAWVRALPLEKAFTLCIFALVTTALIWAGIITFKEFGGAVKITEKLSLPNAYALFQWPFWFLLAAGIAALFRRVLTDSRGAGEGKAGAGGWSTAMKVLFGLLGAAALVLVCIKLFTSFMRDLEASGNTMSTRYAHVAVPQSAVQTSTPPQVQRVTAPQLAQDGTTNWSAAVHRRDDRWFYLFVPDSLTNFVERRVDGVVTNLAASAMGRRNEFRSLTNEAIVVRWLESERQLSPEERARIEP